MTANAEHTDDTLVSGRRRRTPRTFVEPRPDTTTQTDPDPLLDEDLETDLSDNSIDESQDLPDEAEDATPMYAYEAVACQVSLGPDDDAFASTLILTGDDDAGDDVSVWMRLTPTLITQLTQQLTQIYQAQQEAMGLPTSDPRIADDEDDQEDDDEREGLIRRASDPLGLRFLRDRPASVKWLALAIGSLLVISLILRATVFG